ncbi:MAG: hypothetical protein IPO30_06080 [Hyphomonadaceae bacterium]|nr:hypothetical protein [Hyphomonadaceae bacterium]
MRIIGWIAALAAAATLIACAGAGSEQTGKQPAIAPAALAPAPKTLTISDASFGCIRDLKPVRGFFVGNLLGDVDATLAAANAGGAKPYPPGSVVQLVPTEVMVKHPAGYNAATNDWEFFELDVQPGVNKIRVRGSTEVVNQFGGNCLTCHARAEAKWDMICEQDHGCLPIPIPAVMQRAIQNTDPRCAKMELPADQAEALQQLAARRAAAAAAAAKPAATTSN